MAVIVTAAMLPAAALAQEDGGTTVRTAGLDLSDKTEAEVNQVEGWSWSPDGEGGYTLVLENVNISTQTEDAITLPNNVDVDIILKGNNRIEGLTALFGVETKGGLVTIKGADENASLTAVSNENSSWGTISISNLLIESGKVYTEGDGNVIDNFAMTGGIFTINQTLNFGAYGWAALHTVNRVSITGGRLEITTDESEGSYGIYNYPSQSEGESGVYIGGDAEVIVNKSNVGIVVFEKGSGISDGSIEIAGGSVKINSANIGLYTAVEDIILSGGNIEITSDNIALRAVQGNIDFTGSDTGINAPIPTSISDGKQVIGTFHDVHQWDEEWSYDNDGHWKECINAGCDAKGEYAVHTGGTATCTEQAVCTICNQKYGSLGEHSMTYCEEVAATCTQPGNIAYWHCSVCGKNFEDEQGSKELASIEIPAGHKAEKVEGKAPTAVQPGNIEYWYCGECKQYFKDEALTEIITKEETVLAPTGGTTDIPQTGDSGNIALWAALILLASGILTGRAVYYRKRRNG